LPIGYRYRVNATRTRANVFCNQCNWVKPRRNGFSQTISGICVTCGKPAKASNPARGNAVWSRCRPCGIVSVIHGIASISYVSSDGFRRQRRFLGDRWHTPPRSTHRDLSHRSTKVSHERWGIILAPAYENGRARGRIGAASTCAGNVMVARLRSRAACIGLMLPAAAQITIDSSQCRNQINAPVHATVRMTPNTIVATRHGTPCTQRRRPPVATTAAGPGARPASCVADGAGCEPASEA
jgi:hypothetical protein